MLKLHMHDGHNTTTTRSQQGREADGEQTVKQFGTVLF